MSNANFEALWSKAYAAGLQAGQNAIPTPMIVREGNLDGSAKAGGKSWYVSEGPCGFAWVTVRPGNCAFANWAKKKGLMSRAYGGGVQYWVGEFNQSIARKEAFAYAAADVLQEAGIKAYGGSRLD